METIKIARIALAAATYAIDKPYGYQIPEALAGEAVAGKRCLVPFGRGNRLTEGVILSVEDAEDNGKFKALSSLLDEETVLSAREIRLALWMRDRYFCTMYDAIRTILPAGLWFKMHRIYCLCNDVEKPQAYDSVAAIAGASRVLDILYANGCKAEEEVLETACGPRAKELLNQLVSMGLLKRDMETVRHVKDGKTKMVRLALPAEEAMTAVEAKKRSAPLRYAVVQLLAVTGPVSQAEVCYFTGASSSTITSLKKSGLVEAFEEEKLRIDVREVIEPAADIVLNEEQEKAFEQILDLTRTKEPQAILLHGVTGSGKTQVYIRLIQEVLSQGKNAIVLVPEIALTPQMMRKFKSYFDEDVVMLHSGLRMTELYDQWKRIRRGEVRVVLGTRSAIFAPLDRVGLIILDEEQESSYQSENSPRYHAREIAQYLCAAHKATLVLGSATPSVDTFYAAQNGVYQFARLRQRYNRQELPEVVFADMKQELQCGNFSVISEKLRQELAQNIENSEQSILLLNRRGSSRMLLCGECGYVPECPNCSVPMTYHSANGRLMCHYCGHSEKTLTECPECGGLMKRVGVGTQKAEEELHTLFPDTEILRMDADTVSMRGGHEKILKQFVARKVPILLGTQMVAKGLDFSNVTLVGVLAADFSLYIDHYCAAERTFSLLTQVIGRAGRGNKHGRAVIQTFTPEHEVLQCAAAQDYDKFYEGEILMRKLHLAPPFMDRFTFVVSGAEENRVLRSSAILRDAMKRALSEDGTYLGHPVQIIGPAPAPITKVNNRYRYHVNLIGKNNKPIRDFISFYIKEFTKNKENRNLNVFVYCNAND